MRCCLAFASGLPVKSHTGSPLLRGGWYVKLIRRTRTRIHGNLWRTDRLDLRCCSSAVVERGDRNLTRLCEPRSLEDRKKAAPFRARPKFVTSTAIGERRSAEAGSICDRRMVNQSLRAAHCFSGQGHACCSLAVRMPLGSFRRGWSRSCRTCSLTSNAA